MVKQLQQSGVDAAKAESDDSSGSGDDQSGSSDSSGSGDKQDDSASESGKSNENVPEAAHGGSDAEVQVLKATSKKDARGCQTKMLGTMQLNDDF